MSVRHYSLLDHICVHFDQVVRTLANNPKTTGKPYPAEHLSSDSLSPQLAKKSAALMRVNHAGEICAQALYQGQALVSRRADIRLQMEKAAIEEGDHLDWCKRRINELGDHVSYLNPLWYMGSFIIGSMAGLVGDSWSLGFVAETEQQVMKHLEGHMQQLQAADNRSFQILAQMAQDEAKHRQEALLAGGKLLPEPIKYCMAWTAKIMVKTAYWL